MLTPEKAEIVQPLKSLTCQLNLVPVVFSGKKPSHTSWLGKHVLCGFHTELNFSFLKVTSGFCWSCQRTRLPFTLITCDFN